MARVYKGNILSKQLSPHFNLSEFRCKCGKSHDTLLDDALWQKLEELYAKLNCSKIIISSGYRCIAHDIAVGGAGGGYHTKGMAADCCCYDKKGNPINTKIVSCVAQDLGFGGMANINSSYTYIHLDVRTGGRWFGNETLGYGSLYKNGKIVTDFYDYYSLTRDYVNDFCHQYDDETDDDNKDNGETNNQNNTAERGKDEVSMNLDQYLMNGIDVSTYQKNVDYNKVKAAGYDFVIIRAGYGRVASQKDAEFETHYKNAKAAGLHVGAYWYSYTTTPEDALTEAKVCAEILKGHQLDMPVYYDIEEQKTLNTGRANVDKIAHTFCEYMESQGYFCGIYGGETLFKNLLYPETTNRFCSWYAQYLLNPRWTGFGMWQFGISGAGQGNNPFGVPQIPGISGQCDVNRCYVDYPSIIKSLGSNGYGKQNTDPVVEPEPQPTTPTYTEPTRTLKEGDSGDDVKWLQDKLNDKGYYIGEISGKFDIITLGAVLAFQKKNGLVVDGLVGAKTRNALKK